MAEKSKQKMSGATIAWLIVGGIVGVAAVAGIVVGIMAANGAFASKPNSDGPDSPFEDISCPDGKMKICETSDDGKETCGCAYRAADLKPIIYLYPEEKMDVTVRLGAPEKLTASYPKYTDGWQVTAYPNGDLIDKKTGNKLYSLYWEGIRDVSKLDLDTGFVVKREDSAKFLEEKLDYLGLNYKEKEEFIVYWLQRLEQSNYNFIHFATEEEINSEMPLELSVRPDTTIRIRMIFKGLDGRKEVREQKLAPAPKRSGFTVVEWGGTELKK